MTIKDRVTTLLSMHYSKKAFAEELGISRPTLDKRLEDGSWKKLEIESINRTYGKHYAGVS